MQQGLQRGIDVEVSALTPENHVLEKKNSRSHVLPHLLELVIEQDDLSEDQSEDEQGDQRGEESSDATRVKLTEAETSVTSPCFDTLVEDPTDQVARDHKEDIHPGEASGQYSREGVIDDHAEHGNSPQAINIWAVFEC